MSDAHGNLLTAYCSLLTAHCLLLTAHLFPEAQHGLGFIGLGRMGLNMVKRLTRGGHRVVASLPAGGIATRVLEAGGGEYAGSREELLSRLPSPHVIWLMVPAGAPVDENIDDLLPLLSPGDLLIDGGNSFSATRSDASKTRSV